MNLRWIQPTFSFLVIRDACCHASWHIAEISSGNHVGIVTVLYFQYIFYYSTKSEIPCDNNYVQTSPFEMKYLICHVWTL